MVPSRQPLGTADPPTRNPTSLGWERLPSTSGRTNPLRRRIAQPACGDIYHIVDCRILVAAFAPSIGAEHESHRGARARSARLGAASGMAIRNPTGGHRAG
jgi:hypothetical protein